MDPLFAALLCFLVITNIMTGQAVIRYKISPDGTGMPKAIASVEEKMDPALSCQVWETRHLEQKLVDADVIKRVDMTTCDDTSCLNCKPTRLAKDVANRVAIEESRYKRDQQMYEIEMKRKEREWRKSFDNYPKPRYRFPNEGPDVAEFEEIEIEIDGRVVRTVRVAKDPERVATLKRKLRRGFYDRYTVTDLIALGLTMEDIADHIRMASRYNDINKTTLGRSFRRAPSISTRKVYK